MEYGMPALAAKKSRLAAPAAFSGILFDYFFVQRSPSSTSGFGNVKK